ncbi:MAG: ABC transporter permease subunit [Actinomycetota bacterium]|nr:ABC transporter permease subunit [Actinomycetota bacterium]
MTIQTIAPSLALPDALVPARRVHPGRRLPARLGLGVLRTLLSVALVLVLWEAFLKVFHVSSFVGKGPLDVWRYLTSQSSAAANRTAVLHESATTLRDAVLGLAGGTLAAIGAALTFHLWKLASQALMPVAITLRSVPLVAMTPLIVGVFGQNLGAVTIIAGVVTFFPTLVNLTIALNGTPQEAVDLCRAYGAGPRTTLIKVQIPTALPALFASLRIAAPLALVGALLAEWLATGKGLGYTMLTAGAQSDYPAVWARVVAATVYALALYVLVGVVERAALGRFGSTTT